MEVIKRLLAKNDTFLKDQTELNPDMIEAVKNYTGLSFSRINKILRDMKGGIERMHKGDKTKQEIMSIDALFSLVDPLTEPITLYRGVRFEGFTKEDYGFISTSYDIYQALRYTNPECCLMVINVPVGTRCIFVEKISQYEEEREVLLPRNGKFVLTSVGLSQQPGEKNRYFVTFVPSTAVEAATISDAVAKGAEKLKIVEKVVETVEKELLPGPEAQYYTNQLLYVNNSEGK
jgi:hypothetical protein